MSQSSQCDISTHVLKKKKKKNDIEAENVSQLSPLQEF